jgi:hypothetical protein
MNLKNLIIKKNYKMKAYIYKITSSKTTDFYIGSTIQELKNRFKTHKSDARLGKEKKLYDCMRLYGIENFIIELVEEFDIDNKRDPKLGKKETEYYNKLNPSLNMISPKISQNKEYGKIYRVKYEEDEKLFYIGSTEADLSIRLSQHKSASVDGTTLFYKSMREKGRDNFIIECTEDNVPINELIIRENYWINELKPTLNKNTNLCITEKERDRIKYVKNREKILESVSKRRVLKRDEINSQKLEHYHLNKERILNADKEKRKILRETVFEIYKDSPNFTEDSLNKYKIIELKSIAKKFDLKVSPKVKDALINKILDKQKKMFAGTPFK